MIDNLLKYYRTKEDAFVGAGGSSKRDVLEFLLKDGVDVNCKDSHFGDTALHRAASMGSVKTVAFLLDRGAAIDVLDGNRLTPLANACSKGKKMGSAVALLLLRRGADAKYVRESDGMTAYKFGLWGQCLQEVFDALEQAGAEKPGTDFRIIQVVGQ